MTQNGARAAKCESCPPASPYASAGLGRAPRLQTPQSHPPPSQLTLFRWASAPHPQQLDNPFANSAAKFHTAVRPPVTFRQAAAHPCGNSFSFSRKIPRTGAQSVHFVRPGSTREWKFVHPLVQISTRVYSARSLCSVVDSKSSAVVVVRTGNVRPPWRRYADEQGTPRARFGIARRVSKKKTEPTPPTAPATP